VGGFGAARAAAFSSRAGCRSSVAGQLSVAKFSRPVKAAASRHQLLQFAASAGPAARSDLKSLRAELFRLRGGASGVVSSYLAGRSPAPS
jgi:hypothetical protein